MNTKTATGTLNVVTHVYSRSQGAHEWSHERSADSTIQNTERYLYELGEYGFSFSWDAPDCIVAHRNATAVWDEKRITFMVMAQSAVLVDEMTIRLMLTATAQLTGWSVYRTERNRLTFVRNELLDTPFPIESIVTADIHADGTVTGSWNVRGTEYATMQSNIKLNRVINILSQNK